MGLTTRLFGGERSLLIAHIKEAMAGEVCPVCALAREAERRYLEMLLHERVNDEATREQLTQRHGFCPDHTGLLLAVGGYGCHAKVALLYQAQVQALTREVAEMPDSGRVNGELISECAVCATIARTEALYCELLAQRLNDERLRSAFQSGPTLCLRHFARTYDQARPAVRAFLRAHQRERPDRLAQELGEFVRKSVCACAGETEPFGEERDAWLRALRLYDGALPR